MLVKKNLAPGTIVILHDGLSNSAQTIRALPQLLAAADNLPLAPSTVT